MDASRTRQIGYAIASFLLGAWAFVKVNSISGPAFEPIIAACTNPDIPIDEFVSRTGYHAYEPRVGLGVFNFLVCLITQFLLELRETHPAGVLVWSGVILTALPVSLLTVEAGRPGVRGPICYVVTIGLLAQLLGISVVFPLIWLPAFIFGEGKRGAPVTSFRIYMIAILLLPGIIMTLIVFLAPTDSHLWTTCAGMLGGPILPMFHLILFNDGSSKTAATKQNVKASSDAIQNVCKLLMAVGFVGWIVMVGIAYDTYGTSTGDLWRDIWVNANASVAFMTIDTGVLYLGVLLFIAYRADEVKAAKTLLITPILGPATAATWAIMKIERKTKFEGDVQKNEKQE
eukprot:jgi/Psemu1/24398/gm1.24398_g